MARSTKSRDKSVEPTSDPAKGLFRTVLAGPGQKLDEAFANLESGQRLERVWRHSGRDLFGARVSLASEEGEGYWDFVRIRNDVYVVTENFSYIDPRVERLSGDGLIQFYFKLSGDLTMAISRAEPLRLNRPSLFIYYHPPGTEISEWTAPRAHERCVAVNVRPRFLHDVFLRELAHVPPKLAALTGTEPSRTIEYFQLPLSPSMFELAGKLVDHPLTEGLGLVYTEAVVLQLLCLAVSSIGGLPALPTERYTDRELRCLHAARKILMTELARPPTIRQLSRTAGLNIKALKHGFKAIFGETIFEFSLRCRMQHALVLLRKQRTQVAQVAAAVGYRHQTSFATAFRRHFQMSPKDARRDRDID